VRMPDVQDNPALRGELDEIRALFLQMAVRAEGMVHQAFRATLSSDPHRARAVLDADRALDAMEVAIDARCVRTLGRHHPTGVALRFVTVVLKMVTDLERIGDLAVNIAERALEIGLQPGLGPPAELGAMADHVFVMLRDVTDAIVRVDSGVLSRLLPVEAELDALHASAFRTLQARMVDHPDQVARALAWASVGRHLERIGDHVINLARLVVLQVEGRDVRHLIGGGDGPAS
jgi:phosphate transport system protein